MPHARNTDPRTSHEAATSVKNLTLTQQAIVNLLASPMADEELVERYRLRTRAGLAPMASESGIRSRRHELAERGLVKAVGETKTASGRKALVWKAN